MTADSMLMKRLEENAGFKTALEGLKLSYTCGRGTVHCWFQFFILYLAHLVALSPSENFHCAQSSLLDAEMAGSQGSFCCASPDVDCGPHWQGFPTGATMM